MPSLLPLPPPSPAAIRSRLYRESVAIAKALQSLPAEERERAIEMARMWIQLDEAMREGE